MSQETEAPLMVAPFRLDSLREAPPAPAPSGSPSRRERGDHSLHSHRRRRSRRPLTVLLVFLLLVAAAAAFVGLRLHASDPTPTVTPALARAVHVAPATVTLPWPDVGQGAVAVPAAGVNIASGPEQPAPVASLTKLMTAYVILRDHPLAPGQAGPTITVSQADVDDYNFDAVNDDSNAAVTLGEQITEQQVLGGLLVHSADNYANLLARWDAVTLPAFVAKMNAAAARLGMSQSHFADASGVDPGSKSTASDILKVAAPDMENPVFAALVKMPSVTLPVAGTISTYTPFLGFGGVLGVKSGFTTAAGGCDVVAVEQTLHGRPTLLLAAVTGQTGIDVLAQAGLHGLALVNALGPLVGTTKVLDGGQLAAHVGEADKTVDATVASSASVLSWPGVTVRRTFVPASHLTDRARRGAVVGSVVVTLGSQRVVVPVHLQQDVPRPTLLQRLF